MQAPPCRWSQQAAMRWTWVQRGCVPARTLLQKRAGKSKMFRKPLCSQRELRAAHMSRDQHDFWGFDAGVLKRGFMWRGTSLAVTVAAFANPATYVRPGARETTRMLRNVYRTIASSFLCHLNSQILMILWTLGASAWASTRCSTGNKKGWMEEGWMEEGWMEEGWEPAGRG